MQVHEGCYIKEANSYTFWLVDDGIRIEMRSLDEVYRYGLRPIHVVSAEELAAIPTEKPKEERRAKRARGDADADDDAADVPADGGPAL